MADTEKVARLKALIEEVKEISKELTEEELAQVAGGLSRPFGEQAPDQPDDSHGPLCNESLKPLML
jgi:bacteriocin-like protein